MEVAGVEPASKKCDVEARYRLGPVRVTSAGGNRATLIEDGSPGLGRRQGSRGNLSCPAVRQTEVTRWAV